MELEGTILRGREFEPVEGRVVIEEGRVERIEAEPVASTDIVCPAFVNAHTHVGDSIAKEAGGGLSLAELVAPPDGLKHRLLRGASREELVGSIRRSLAFMRSGGTAAFLDFREGGVEGVSVLREAAEGLDLTALAYARESVEAMADADGFGASGANDADFETERAAAREAGKPFAIHAGEGDPSDLTPALDLEPDHLVHVVHPEEHHLERIERESIPVVCCPRSNLVTGVGLPPLAELASRTTLALGTDNVMLNSPSMFREMEFAAKCSSLSAPQVLRMATIDAAAIAGLDYGPIEVGERVAVTVIDGDSDNLAGARDPVRAVVRRAGVDDVRARHVPPSA